MKIRTLISSALMVAGWWLGMRHCCFLQALAPTSLRKDCPMAMKLTFIRMALVSLSAAMLLLPSISGAALCPDAAVTILGDLSVTATKVDGATEQIEGVPYAACIPPEWDGRRAFYYSHGTDADTTLEGIQGQLTLPDGTRLQDLFVQLGIPFAWLARSDPGLSDINVAVAELLVLQETLNAELKSRSLPTPAYSYISGVSQGAGITTTVLEREPTSFSGAVAVCGPIGSFWRQLFRSVDIYNLLDHYLSDAILQRANLSDAERLLEKDSSGSPAIPASVVAGADALEDAIEALFIAPTAKERRSIGRFLGVTRLASKHFYAANPELVASEIAGMMSEVVRNFNDGVETLGGQVYNNRHRIYYGSGQDFLLNLRIQRFDPHTSMARDVVDNFFETSGKLYEPLVAPHNLPDPRVPFWHELLYEFKAASMGAAALHTTVPLPRYGHCNIKLPETLAALAILILQVEGLDLLGSDALLSDSRSRSIFDSLLDEAR